MCPERGILSAYLDAEIEEPWIGRVEAHLADCASCRFALETLRSIRARVLSEEEPDLVDAMVRVRNAIATRAPFAVRRWRLLSIPLPLAVAAAGLVLALGAAFVVSLVRPYEPSTVRFTASPTGIRQFEIEGKPDDIHRLLKLLNRDAEERIVTFDIPKDYRLTPLGDPQFRSAVQTESP